MDSWSQWSALLVPHPNPHLFTGKKTLYRLSAPSSLDSQSSFMFLLSQKRGKLKKPLSPPPEIQPLSFEYEPMLDMTTHISGFFPTHDYSDVNENVHVFHNCTTLDGNLMSQPSGAHIPLFV
jgi:hypothetical protein